LLPRDLTYEKKNTTTMQRLNSTFLFYIKSIRNNQNHTYGWLWQQEKNKQMKNQEKNHTHTIFY